MTLSSLLKQAVEILGSQTAAARAIGVDPSRFNKVLRGRSEYDSFEVGTCLRLARAIACPPVDVLKAAGKAEDAALIVELFGDAQKSVLTPDEGRLVALMRRGGSAAEFAAAVHLLTGKMLAATKGRSK